MSIYIPYFYVIQDTRNGMYYAGVKWGRDANPEKFMVEGGYTTSSNSVNKIIETYGLEVFTTRKIKTFNNKKYAINYETRFLKKIDAKNNPRFYNKQNNDHLFTYQDDRYKEKMLEIYGVEYPLKSIDLQIRQQQNNIEKYGVGNVFQADFVKDKIKETNIERYGVEHPSYSEELLEKRAQNNMEKYGVRSTFQLPHVREKALQNIWTEETREKRIKTNIKKYGHETPSSSEIVREKVLETRKTLSDRAIVKLLREYSRYFSIKLGYGWYQLSDEKLDLILSDVQIKYGYYTYEEMSVMKPKKRYSDSIKKLQSRKLVKEIRKYKDKYGRKITIGRVWDRKSDEQLETILENLVNEYGPI